MMYEAVLDDPSAPRPTIAQMRRMVKMLIDRALVLGPVDRAQVHDIILDFSIGQFTEESLRRAHRRAISLIRERRPASTEYQDRFGWEASLSEDAVVNYIIRHCEWHVKETLERDWAADQDLIAWLSDYAMMQDAVPLAIAAVLGIERVSELAQRAEQDGDWWTAALRWSALAIQVLASGNPSQAANFFRKCAACLEAVEQPAQPSQQRARDRLELSTVLSILMFWNPADLPVYTSRLVAACQTEVAKEDPESVARGIHISEYYTYFPRAHRGDGENLRLMCQGGIKHALSLIRPALALPRGSFRRTVLLAEGCAFSTVNFFALFALYADMDWDELCGEHGSYIKELHAFYDFDMMHSRIIEICSWDCVLSGGMAYPLVVRYGDLAGANVILDGALGNIRLFLSNPNTVFSFDAVQTLYGALIMLMEVNRFADAAELMRQFGWDWEGVDASVKEVERLTTMVGEPETGALMNPASLIMISRILYAVNLCFSDAIGQRQLADFVASLPSAHDIAMLGVIHVPEIGLGPFHPLHAVSGSVS